MAPGLGRWTRTGPHCILRPVNPPAPSVNESWRGRERGARLLGCSEGSSIPAEQWRRNTQRRFENGVASRVSERARRRKRKNRDRGTAKQRRRDLSFAATYSSPLSPAAVRNSHFSSFFSYHHPPRPSRRCSTDLFAFLLLYSTVTLGCCELYQATGIKNLDIYIYIYIDMRLSFW